MSNRLIAVTVCVLCVRGRWLKKLADIQVEAVFASSVFIFNPRLNPCSAAPRYLVLFLKFIASVVPTIQYDYTMSVGGE